MSSSRWRITLAVLLGLSVWFVSRTAFHASLPAVAKGSTETRLYMLNFQGSKLVPVNARTLANLEGARSITIPSRRLHHGLPAIFPASASSTTAVVYYEQSGDWPTQAKNTTIRRLDAVTGRPRGRAFHPAAPVWLDGISPDGSQLYGLRLGPTTASSCPFSGYQALDASNGRVLSSAGLVQDCNDLHAYGVANHRLYVLSAPPDDTGQSAAHAPTLSAYDLLSGRKVGSLRIDGVLAGQWTTDRTDPQVGGAPVIASWNPGFALSPDGRQIAVLDGSDDRLTLIDAPTLEIARTVSVTRPSGLVERLTGWLGVSPGVAEAKEAEGANLSMQFSPDGRRLLVTGTRMHVDDQGTFQMTDQGLRSIDVSSGQLVAEATPDQHLWLWTFWPSPDGSAIYTLDSLDRSSADCPCMLQRRDATSLEVTAQRLFQEQVHLYFLRATGK